MVRSGRKLCHSQGRIVMINNKPQVLFFELRRKTCSRPMCLSSTYSREYTYSESNVARMFHDKSPIELF